MAGERTYDGEWDDNSAAALADEDAHREAVLRQLAAFDPGALSERARLNLTLYAGLLRDEREAYALGMPLFAIDPRHGVHTYAYYAEQLRFAGIVDYDNWQRRLAAFPRAVDQTIALLREGIACERMWPRATMARLLDQLDRLDIEPASSPFFAPLVRVPAGIDGDAERLRASAHATIAEAVLPALRRLRTFLHDDYLPRASEIPGLAQLRDGAAIYAHLTRTLTTTDLSAEQIHRLGLSEVQRIREAMEALAPRTGYTGSLGEVFAQLRADPANYCDSPEALLQTYRAIAKRVDPELPPLFRTLPRLPYGVTMIPAALAPDTTTAYYYPGALDGSRAGLYYVNLYRPDQRPTYEMMALSLHEAVPGHHLQIALAQELPNLPAFRRTTLAYTAYVEGWGLYAESLGDEMGLYDDPKAKFGALTYEMWRAVRLVVDTGIHAFGWSRERAIAYFLDNAPKAPLDVENEVDRYITMPAQALAYKIGELKIRELRARARSALGPRFDVRDFHEVVLGEGALPLDVLAARVDAWLAENAAPAS
nr:DUF885 domain-containing protein [Vulcanimicrobium alpinum]